MKTWLRIIAVAALVLAGFFAGHGYSSRQHTADLKAHLQHLRALKNDFELAQSDWAKLGERIEAFKTRRTADLAYIQALERQLRGDNTDRSQLEPTLDVSNQFAFERSTADMSDDPDRLRTQLTVLAYWNATKDGGEAGTFTLEDLRFLSGKTAAEIDTLFVEVTRPAALDRLDAATRRNMDRGGLPVREDLED